LVDPLRRSGADEDNIDPQEDEKKDRRDEEKGLDLQGVFPFREKFLRNIIEEKLPLHNIQVFKQHLMSSVVLRLLSVVNLFSELRTLYSELFY